MERVAAWLGGPRHRAILLAAALFMVPLLMPLSAALMAFVTLLKGAREATLAALAAAGVLGVMALVTGGAPLPLFLTSLAVLLAVVGISALVAGSGSMSYGFQVAVLGAALLAAVMAAAAQGAGLYDQLVPEFADLVRATGATGGEAEQLAAVLVDLLFGLALGGLLLSVMIALMLGCWLHGLATAQAVLGPQFRQLTAGRLVTGIASVVLVAALVRQGGWVADAAMVFVLAFVLQGLSVVHAHVALRGWNPLWLAALYGLLLLPTPAAPALATGLTTVGYLDNWLGFRRRAGYPPETGND